MNPLPLHRRTCRPLYFFFEPLLRLVCAALSPTKAEEICLLVNPSSRAMLSRILQYSGVPSESPAIRSRIASASWRLMSRRTFLGMRRLPVPLPLPLLGATPLRSRISAGREASWSRFAFSTHAMARARRTSMTFFILTPQKHRLDCLVSGQDVSTLFL